MPTHSPVLFSVSRVSGHSKEVAVVEQRGRNGEHPVMKGDQLELVAQESEPVSEGAGASSITSAITDFSSIYQLSTTHRVEVASKTLQFCACESYDKRAADITQVFTFYTAEVFNSGVSVPLGYYFLTIGGRFAFLSEKCYFVHGPNRALHTPDHSQGRPST